MTQQLDATYYRTGLLLGLVRGEEVHRWAEGIIEREPDPSRELLDLILIPSTDLSALRHALWPLSVEPEPAEVIKAMFGLLHADLTEGVRATDDTVTVLRQMRSMMRLPPSIYANLNEALVSHGLAKATGGTISEWLGQFAGAKEALFRAS